MAIAISAITEIKEGWAPLKKFINGTWESYPLYYKEWDTGYFCFALGGCGLVVSHVIYKDDKCPPGVDETQNTSDRTDFLNNFQSGARCIG